jgi:flavin-dependent dehydrogenase
MSAEWDAVVIGAGPGGSTFSTMFSRLGQRVLVLEKETFPRYHIGESLLPANWRVLDAVGVGDKVRQAPFIPKAGGTFIWGLNREPWTVYFGEVNGLPAARQVKREEFDKILMEHAIENGATVRQNCTVKEVLFEGSRAVGVRYIDQDGMEQMARARWVIDASGQSKLIGRRLGLVEYHPDFRNAAVWSYWKGGKRLSGKDAGNIIYVSHEHGWFWYIPLDNASNLISVGTIIRSSGRPLLKKMQLDDFYHQMLAATDVIPDMLSDATQITPVRAISDYSYSCSQMAGPGWILVGDASCFVDPVLSSGVQLATYHGLFAAVMLNTVLQHPELEEEALAYYQQQYQSQYTNFVHLCLNMYDTAKKSKEDYFASARQMLQPRQLNEMPTNGQSSPRPDKDFGDRLAFIGLISGLPAQETQKMVMDFFTLRKKALEAHNEDLAFNDDALNSMFDQIVQKSELQEGRATRIGEELEQTSVLRLAPGVELREKFFLPPDIQEKQLARMNTIENRFGGRFYPTEEIVQLFDLINGERTYGEIEERFFRDRQVDATPYRELFRNWIDLLADHAIVEWQKL